MYQVRTRIKGLSPILFHRVIPEIDVPGLITGKGQRKMTLEAMEKVAWDRAYKENGHFILPRHMFKSCIKNGAKMVPWQRRKNTSEIIKAIVYVDNDSILGQLDGLHRGTMPRQKTNELIYCLWPCKKEWEAEFTLRVLDSTYPPSCIEDAIKIGGLYYGMGSRRPEFGRFSLEEFEVFKEG